MPQTKTAPLLNLLLLLPSLSGVSEALTAYPVPERDVAQGKYDKFQREKQVRAGKNRQILSRIRTYRKTATAAMQNMIRPKERFPVSLLRTRFPVTFLR